MRRPRMHGFPLRLPRSMVIWSECVTRAAYATTRDGQPDPAPWCILMVRLGAPPLWATREPAGVWRPAVAVGARAGLAAARPTAFDSVNVTGGRVGDFGSARPSPPRSLIWSRHVTLSLTSDTFVLVQVQHEGGSKWRARSGLPQRVMTLGLRQGRRTGSRQVFRMSRAARCRNCAAFRD